MYHFFVSSHQITENLITIDGPDVNHIRNVLRLKPGDVILISDESGTDYRCALLQLQPEQVTASVLEKSRENHELSARIYLFQGLPKSDKMEWIIQKAVELGVHQIIPVAMKNCVVKLDTKKADAKVRRWNAISESAAKQSKRSIIPTVAPVHSFSDAVAAYSFFDKNLMAYENARGMAATKEQMTSVAPGMEIGVWIGPEGGFDPAEVETAAQHGILPISLGARILRTETAGLAALSLLMYHLEIQNCPSDSASHTQSEVRKGGRS